MYWCRCNRPSQPFHILLVLCQIWIYYISLVQPYLAAWVKTQLLKLPVSDDSLWITLPNLSISFVCELSFTILFTFTSISLSYYCYVSSVFPVEDILLYATLKISIWVCDCICVYVSLLICLFGCLCCVGVFVVLWSEYFSDISFRVQFKYFFVYLTQLSRLSLALDRNCWFIWL